MKRVALLVAGILISVVSLWYALQGFVWSDVVDAMLRIRPLFFLAMIVPYVLTFMTKVWRWRTMFHPDEHKTPISMLFSTLMISYVPLPFRAGEVARAVVTAARSGIPVARVISTILVEKVLDVLTLLLLLGISLPFVDLPSGLQGTATVLGVGFVIAGLVLLGLAFRPAVARRISQSIAARLPARLGPRIEALTDNVLQGLVPLSRGRAAGWIVVWSIATWSVNTLTVYLLLQAFNINTPYMAAVVLCVATNLGMAVPSAPGYVGTFEAVVVLVLGILGIGRADAQTFALVYHFVGLVPVALIGIFAVFQQGFGLAVFRQNVTPVPQTQPAGRDPGSREKQ